MSTIGSSTQTTPIHTYRLRNYRWLLIFYAAMFLLEGSVLILHMVTYYYPRLESYQACLKTPDVILSNCEYWKPNETAHLLVVAGTLVAIAGSLLVMSYAWRARLVLSPEEVLYDDGLFFRIRTSWDNVSGIYQLEPRTLGFLVLREPRLEASPLTAWLAGPKARRLIPLSQFDRRWRTGSIGKDIRRFAPQLLDQEAVTTIS